MGNKFNISLRSHNGHWSRPPLSITCCNYPQCRLCSCSIGSEVTFNAKDLGTKCQSYGCSNSESSVVWVHALVISSSLALPISSQLLVWSMVCRPTKKLEETDGKFQVVDCGVTPDVTPLAGKFETPKYVQIDIISDFTSWRVLP